MGIQVGVSSAGMALGQWKHLAFTLSGGVLTAYINGVVSGTTDVGAAVPAAGDPRGMFIGIEAMDEEGLAHHRKRTTISKNLEALEFARSLGITVAINLIADPAWDRRRFEIVRQWCLEIPEIVNISVNTPYPGTESWHTEARHVTTRDYRLYDIQHAVLPTTLPLPEFYAELQGLSMFRELAAPRLSLQRA